MRIVKGIATFIFGVCVFAAYVVLSTAVAIGSWIVDW